MNAMWERIFVILRKEFIQALREPRMRVLLDFLANWFREARNEERAVPKPAAAVTPAITPRTNGAQASGARVRLRAG